MIDVSRERVLSPTQAAVLLGVTRQCVYGWIAGKGGKRLRSGKLGGKVVTSVEALNEFQTDPSTPKPKRQRTPRFSAERQARHDAALGRLRTKHKMNV